MSAASRRRWKIGAGVVATVVLLLVLSFVINGTLLSYGETPIAATTAQSAAPLPNPGDEVTVVAFNIAKGFAYRGGVEFDSVENVRARITEIAEVIRAAKPDLVFLSKAVLECGPCPVDQVGELAEATGMHAWAFGENYNFGLTGYRIVGGNAILSRWPLEPVANPDLAGRQPFYVTQNNRRVLWCRMRLPSGPVLLGSIHTDSFDLKNNLRQTEQILAYIGDQPAMIAGDFNCQPHEPSIGLIKASGKFRGEFEGPLTFPAHQPEQRLDYIFAPRDWELLESRPIASEVSDHLPVFARFRLPKTGNPR